MNPFRVRSGWVTALICLAVHSYSGCSKPGTVDTSDAPATDYTGWSKGPNTALDFFPISVWLQSPANAAHYKRLGINLYVGLNQGPKEAQLVELEKADMPVICEQNVLALRNLNRKIIVGWLQQDEPDNAQAKASGGGFNPPITPQEIRKVYEKLHKADPDRPVLLNLGQGVAWDRWIGRGDRTNKPEDYQQYVNGGDILSFDIYPAASDNREIAGKLWMVPSGVDRLEEWSKHRKIVWNCIETTRVGNPKANVTPRQVTAEVWMSIIHGSTGIIYFAHQFAPDFIEAGLLADKLMAAAVGKVNAQIKSLAPVLNSPTITNGATVFSISNDVPVDLMVKHHDAATYVFSVAMREGQTHTVFTVPNIRGSGVVTALGEDHVITATDGSWEDDFRGFGVHIYRLADRP